MAGLGALPRSLDPLPDESLPGYLLRLAHRLALTPSRLAARTGLATGGRFATQVPLHTLIHLPDPVRETFAYTARLSTDEVDGLCLHPLSSRYPLPTRHGDDNPGRAHTVRTGRWILAPHTRYCPRCLAGNGTPIQRQHGGAWRRTWHLPVVFACTDHRRLLEHLCPHCRQPVHGTRPGSPVLLPNMRNGGLHPAQCRAQVLPGSGLRIPVCCSTRLDGPDFGDDLEIGQTVLALQQRILALLDPRGPDTVPSAGRDTTPSRYFTDLLVLAALACSSWPALRHMAPSQPTAEAIDRYVDQQHRTNADLQRRSPTTRRRTLHTPPPDAAASAGLIVIADQLLGLDSPDEIREHLRPLFPTSTRQARRSPGGRQLADRAQPDQSDGLRQACQPLLRTFTRGQPHARRDPLRQTRFGPEHVPAFLPEDWYTRHFHHVHGINPKLVRRTATVRLVQLIAGGSLGEAAEYLGINPTGKQYVSSERVHRWARNQPDPRTFEDALLALADELDAAPHPVNYQQRRTALNNWALSAEQWHDIVIRLLPIPGPNQPALGDLKRQCASQVVWSHATQGEHLFAPRPIEATQPPHVQRAWQARRNTIWHQFHTNRPLRHYADLRRLLAEHAYRLASHIDAGRVPTG